MVTCRGVFCIAHHKPLVGLKSLSYPTLQLKLLWGRSGQGYFSPLRYPSRAAKRHTHARRVMTTTINPIPLALFGPEPDVWRVD